MEQSERLKQMKAALVDFLLRAHEVPHLEKIILFGSLLEGDVNKKSDIDLLLIFDTENNPETGVELKTATKIGLEVLKNYQIENNFGFVVVNTQTPSKTDKDFLVKTAGEGVIVWEKGGFNFLERHREMRSQILFTYSTQNLNSKQRVTLYRKLYGYKVTTKQKGKEYQVESSGIVGKYGQKIGANAFLINPKNAQQAEEVFKEYDLPFEKRFLLE